MNPALPPRVAPNRHQPLAALVAASLPHWRRRVTARELAWQMRQPWKAVWTALEQLVADGRATKTADGYEVARETGR